MADFTEVADRVWVARYAWCDVNVTAIGSERGLLVVDTHGSTAAGRAVVDDVRRLGAGDVVGLVNTHVHFDHTFGNRAFLDAYGAPPIHAHETVPEDLAETAARIAAEPPQESDPHRDEVLATEVAVPDRLFSSVLVVDLGDRAVELVHPGRGHTRGDVVVVVPDAGVLLAGDLVEQSATPSFGDDSFPLEWPMTLDVVLQLLRPDHVDVPGHGSAVDRAFVEEQRNEIGLVAEGIRDLASRGVPLAEAAEAGQWPWPVDRLGSAVARGYEQLPRSQRRLPLV